MTAIIPTERERVLMEQVEQLEEENEVLSQIIANYSQGTNNRNLAAQMEAATRLYEGAKYKLEQAEARIEKLERVK